MDLKWGGDLIKREADERLQKLFDEGKKVYSFSKLSTINQCKYQAYLNYVLHSKNRKQNVWGILGSKLHDKLEEITNGKATVEELAPLVNEEISMIDALEIKFPLDFRGGNSIRDNWIANMENFCKTFKPLEGEFDTEELIILKLDDEHYIQGYIDLVKHNDDGSVSILDWKTSSLYKGDALKEAARQLYIYGMAKEAEGYTIKDLSWIFLKYIEVEYEGYKTSRSKNKSKITKVIERRKLSDELWDIIREAMEDSGYDEADITLAELDVKKNNSLDKLPEDIKAKFNVKQYILTIPYTEEGKAETLEFINDTIEDFESRSLDNSDEWEHKDFFVITKTGKEKEDTFFCNCLCDYGDTCKHIKMFNELNNFDDDLDSLFE